VQCVVFVAGGVLGPAAHLVWHRPGHSHGPDGQTLAFSIPLTHHPGHADTAAGRAHGDAAPEESRRHRHAVRAEAHREHGHRHPQPHRHASSHGTAGQERASDGPSAEPLEAPHGHGSLAHLGLALLSAPPALAVPAPRLTSTRPLTPRARAVALFHPGFPPPRPPPAPTPA
jgi:hypothetical protein